MGRTFYCGRSLSFWGNQTNSFDGNKPQVVNGQRLKHYISGDAYNENVDAIQMVSPEEFIITQKQESAESDLE